MSTISFSLSDWRTICQHFNFNAEEVTKVLTNDLNEISLNKPAVKKRAHSQIMARKYDTAKHVELHLLKTQVEPNNVPFDEEAQRKWCEIWGERWKTTCAWTGQHIPTGKGLSVDHLFPIRGAYGNSRSKKTGWLDGGLRGSDSGWNRAMVLKHVNSGFKIFNHNDDHGWKKDVACQDLTPSEFEQCSDQEKRFYNKLMAARAYADKRGAHYKWKFSKSTNVKIEQHYTHIYKILESGANDIKVEFE